MKAKRRLRIGLGTVVLLFLMFPLSTTANDCVATFDPVTGTLTVPCFEFKGIVYDIQLGLIKVELKDFNVLGECTANADCGKNAYCEKSEGDCDGVGICTQKPEVCPLFFDPVVGCDGKTYSNNCDAAASGVNVLADSPCVE